MHWRTNETGVVPALFKQEGIKPDDIDSEVMSRRSFDPSSFVSRYGAGWGGESGAGNDEQGPGSWRAERLF